MRANLWILERSRECSGPILRSRAMTTGTRSPSRTQQPRTIKRELTESVHPAWVESMIANLKPDWNGVCESPLFEATVQGPLPEQSWRYVVLEFFGVVEAFPKYMGVTLGKTTFGRRPGDILARDWLIGNIRTEALHAQWSIDCAVGLLIPYTDK